MKSPARVAWQEAYSLARVMCYFAKQFGKEHLPLAVSNVGWDRLKKMRSPAGRKVGHIAFRIARLKRTNP